MSDTATVDETVTTTAPEKEHPITRLKREHGEMAAKIKELEARLAGSPEPKATPAPDAPVKPLPITPAEFFPQVVAALLAGGRQASEVDALALTAWHKTVGIIEELSNPKTPTARVAETQSQRSVLQAEWDRKDKEAQAHSMQIRVKRDGMARSNVALEKERLGIEIADHDKKMRDLIAECLVLQGRINALASA